jgi:hypothetical protein
VERLLEVILDELSDAEHERKWGQLTFTRDGNWHHWICAISPTAKAVKRLDLRATPDRRSRPGIGSVWRESAVEEAAGASALERSRVEAICISGHEVLTRNEGVAGSSPAVGFALRRGCGAGASSVLLAAGGVLGALRPDAVPG